MSSLVVVDLRGTPGLWLFTLLITGVEWGAEGRKLYPFSTSPVCDYPAQVTKAWPFPFTPCTLPKVPRDKPKVRTSAHLEASIYPYVEWAKGSLQHPLPGARARKGRADILERGRLNPEGWQDLTPLSPTLSPAGGAGCMPGERSTFLKGPDTSVRTRPRDLWSW